MIYTCIYSALLIFLILYCLKKRVNVLGLLLIVVYAFEGVMAIVGIKNEVISGMGVRLLPYLFLIVAYLLFFGPFLVNRNEFSVSKFSGVLDGKCTVFAYIYIVCFLITAKCYIPPVVNVFVSGNWLLNRELLYAGEIQYPYSNMFEYIAINATEYTSILAILIGFLFITKTKKIMFGVILLGTVVLSMFLRTMYSSARGPLVQLLLFFCIMYLFFYKEMRRKLKNVINGLLVLAAVVIIPIIYKITDSRFGAGEFSNTGRWTFSGAFSGTVNSIVYYLGHAPVIFNSGVSIIDKHAYGINGFGSLFGWEKLTPADLGGTYATNFYTFVGWLYIDWGTIGVILIGALCFITFSKIIKKKEYDLADIYLVLFYYQTLLYGVFVIGSAYILNIVVAVIIYVFLKIFVKDKKYRIGEFRI